MRRFAALGVTLIALLALTAGLALAAGAPTVTTGSSSAVTDTTATVAGTVNPQGQLASYAFQYGTTTAYGQQTALTSAGSGSADVAVRADLAGLTPGTTYHYRVIATPTGGGTVVGADQTFTTSGTAPPPPPTPSATTGAAVVSGASATLAGTVNPNGLLTSYYFEFGTTTAYGQQTVPQSAGAGTAGVAVGGSLSGLAADATYHYRLVAIGPNGGISIGADRTFATGGPASTRLGLFGHTAFADQHGVAGVFSACIGSAGCRGSLTLSRSGTTLGTRGSFVLAANDGGFVHFALNDLGQRLLRHRGTMRVQATVTNALVRGQTTSKVITLIRYSTHGLIG